MLLITYKQNKADDCEEEEEGEGEEIDFLEGDEESEAIA